MSESLAIVVTTNAEPEVIPGLKERLAAQTVQPDQIWVYYSGMDVEETPGITWVKTPSFGDWGHTKRAMALGSLRTDWVCFWEAHDIYEDSLVEKIQPYLSPEHDVVYWPWDGRHGVIGKTFNSYDSDAGNFAIRVSLGREVGWVNRDYEADARFIEAVRSRTTRIVQVPIVLMHKT